VRTGCGFSNLHTHPQGRSAPSSVPAAFPQYSALLVKAIECIVIAATAGWANLSLTLEHARTGRATLPIFCSRFVFRCSAEPVFSGHGRHRSAAANTRMAEGGSRSPLILAFTAC
jgi:hypothetical protein